MIKPVAILKDSLREAWDSKTLLVMLKILAGLFLVIFASISYTEATPQTVVDNFFEQMSAPVLRLERGKHTLRMDRSGGGPPRALANFKVTTFRAVKEAAHAPNGEYEFTVLVTSNKDEDVDKSPTNDNKAKGENPKKDAPKVDGLPEADGFNTMVALWHEDGTGRFVKIDEKASRDPSKMSVRVGAVTDEMIRDFLNTELERSTQVPITEFERLPSENPGEHVFRIRTGPSTEPRRLAG